MYQINRNGCQPILKQNIYELNSVCNHTDKSASEKLEYLTFPQLEALGMVKHLISTRMGGVSKGDLSTMNLSFTRGDEPENVFENYRRIAAVLNCEPKDMIASHQTHTTNVRQVTVKDKGKGILYPRDYEDVDGLITNEPGVVLVTYYADCVPLFFVDPIKKAIGLAHSGWRGTVDRMGEVMVKSMQEHFRSNPGDLYACIGPSICKECYEVSEEVAVQFIEEFGEAVLTPGKASGKYQLDLWLSNRMILEQAGIPSNRIQVTDICTCHNPGYLFSHRATGGKRGNIAAFLGLS